MPLQEIKIVEAILTTKNPGTAPRNTTSIGQIPYIVIEMDRQRQTPLGVLEAAVAVESGGGLSPSPASVAFTLRTIADLIDNAKLVKD